jgi:hypothetical protein
MINKHECINIETIVEIEIKINTKKRNRCTFCMKNNDNKEEHKNCSKYYKKCKNCR